MVTNEVVRSHVKFAKHLSRTKHVPVVFKKKKQNTMGLIDFLNTFKANNFIGVFFSPGKKTPDFVFAS